jgi:hypothetical protein
LKNGAFTPIKPIAEKRDSGLWATALLHPMSNKDYNTVVASQMALAGKRLGGGVVTNSDWKNMCSAQQILKSLIRANTLLGS